MLDVVDPRARKIAHPRLVDLTVQVHDALIEHLGTTRLHCRHASLLLVYLAAREGLVAHMMVGAVRHESRPEGEGHFWVQSNFVIYDPTVDQFPGRLRDPLVRRAYDPAYVIEPPRAGLEVHQDVSPTPQTPRAMGERLALERDWHRLDPDRVAAYAAYFDLPLGEPATAMA